MILLAVLALAVGVLTPVAAGAEEGSVDLDGSITDVEKSEYDSYIVVMTADPLLGDFDQDELDSKAAQKKSNGLKKGHDKALKDAGIDVDAKVNEYTNALNGFSAIISYSEAQALAADKNVALVMPDELRQPTTDSSPTFLELDGPAGAWRTGYDGEGVVVGVIDSGIWPEHASFADDGTLPSPPIVLDDSRPNCEFGNTVHNAADVPFSCNDKLIGARQMLDTYRAVIGAEAYEYDSARDDGGHGTHTASTAAGNAGVEASIYDIDRGVVSGIAPRAHVVAYKGLGHLGGFGSDLAAAIDQAVADGVDVINYSVGGGPSLTGADDIAFLFAADAGVYVATSMGNSGPGPYTVGGPASVPWLTSVGASTQARTFEGSALLGDGQEFFGASVTASSDTLPLVDAADLGNELCLLGGNPDADPPIPALDEADVAGKMVLCKRGANARVDKSRAVWMAGGAGMILFNAADTQSEVTDNHWVPSVHINNTDGLVIKDYIANDAAPTATVNGGVYTAAQGSVMASFSSRGPNPVAEDIIKPDVTAPGVNILAGNTPLPGADVSPPKSGAPGQLFQSISGTSMSSPHVAGLFALIKQAHPDWSAAIAKSAIMTTARQDVFKEDGTTAADPFDMGAGHVVPGERVHKGSSFQPGLAYDAGFNDYLGFLCDAEPEALGAGTCDFLDSIGVPTTAENLNYPSIGVADLPGSTTITRTVTSVAKERGWRTYDVSVDAPAGYDVTVEPSSIRLKTGQSATYEVTITNETAPIGAWRYGALTWNDKTGNYSAHSPIAVRGALFDSPASVTGSGETGAASFDVTFGYTGAYSAAGHGLEAATVTSDNVVQDPDQNFDPTDGYSNQHDFTLSGAAYFKVAIPPDAVDNPDIDLDVFVYDPSGTQVASSTNGGTDELIEIPFPADGKWSVFVHGWQTAGPSADYDMYSWVISATPGGNLSVDSAPPSATIGAVEAIGVSWTGATAGEWHLGAVSHTGDTGLMGLTFVEVDNR